MNRVQLVVLSLLSLALAACVTKSVGEKFQAGAVCSKGSDCVSSLCLGQTCCSVAACGSDPTCQATRCDATGACMFPATACGASTCTGTNQLATGICDQGTCVAGTAAACAGHLTCADATSCRTSCSQSSGCTTGFDCSNGSCQGDLPAGTVCSSNSACTSGICGTGGSGHCCSGTCLNGDPHGCGATDCDTAGACVYPSAATACVAQSCTGHTLTEPANCDGQGVCAIPSPATADCAPYQCGTNGACAGDFCQGNGDCSVGFCDLNGRICCPLYPGNQIEVDGTEGLDHSCCGAGTGASACSTIAHAVRLVGETGISGTTVHAANPANGMNWNIEPTPIQLSFGLTLSAPGVFFAASNLPDGGPPDFHAPIFEIKAFGVENSVSAAIEGTASQPVSIGIDSTGQIIPLATAVVVNSPMTLYLLDAVVHDSSVGNAPQNFDRCTDVFGSPYGRNCATGIAVMPGATLTLGTDGNGASGTVRVGDDDTGEQESVGIICYGLVDAGAQGVVNDTGSTAQPSVWIQHHQIGLAAVDGCSVHLSAYPRFGPPLDAQSQCPARPVTDPFQFELAGLYLNNGIDGNGSSSTPTSASVSNGLFQCHRAGVTFQPFGPISFIGDNDTIQYNSIGIENSYGSLRVTGSTLSHNGLGIMVGGGTAQIDLSDAGTQITCNGASECGGMFSVYPTGGGILFDHAQTGLFSVHVSDVAWNHWDAFNGHTQTWTCADLTLSQCSCSGTSTCPPGTGALGANADIIAVGTTAIDDLNGQTASDGCP